MREGKWPCPVTDVSKPSKTRHKFAIGRDSCALTL